MDYYSKVVHDFLNYREYKQRCEHIEKTRKNIPTWLVNGNLENNEGIDYSKDRVQTSGHHDPTSSPVLEAVEDNHEEYIEKKELVEKVERAYKGLDPIEQFIMDRKYKTGRIEEDVNIYTHTNFPYGKTKYYEIKDNAVKKAARIVGYLEEKN